MQVEPPAMLLPLTTRVYLFLPSPKTGLSPSVNSEELWQSLQRHRNFFDIENLRAKRQGKGE